ncbi:MAG: hypothetical protein ABW092_21295 [Candidatus Thiodiazotropha sp.]
MLYPFTRKIITLFLPALLAGISQQAAALPFLGLYDLAVPTNCYLNTAQNLQRPADWEHPVPVFGGNGISLHGRTIEALDVVKLFSSNPALVKVPVTMRLAKGDMYQRSTIRVATMAPSRPTRIRITAQSGNNPLQKATEELLLLPKQFISRFELSPKKSVYQDGDRVTATLHLRWEQPATMPVDFSLPKHSLGGRDWYVESHGWGGTVNHNKRLLGAKNQKVISLPFTVKWPTDREARKFRGEKLALTLTSQLSPSSSCSITTNPSSKALTYYVKNPTYSAPEKATGSKTISPIRGGKI